MFLLLSCISSCKNEKSMPPIRTADTLGSEDLAPEGFSNEVAATSGQLVLPTTFGRRTGDLDQMRKARQIRALVAIDPISFFYSHGRPNGMLYEELEQLERVVNKKFKAGKLKVRVSFIPMRPDELGPALSQGVGDFIAARIVITPGRELANARDLDDLVGRDIYVSPLTTFYDNLIKINEDRAKAGKAPLSVKA